MEIKEFIEKGIEGGWRKKDEPSIFNNKNTGNFECIEFDNPDLMNDESIIFLHEVLLDPKFWEAVGKTENWKSTGLWKEPEHIELMEWMLKMDGLMPHLQDGGTIKSYIKTL